VFQVVVLPPAETMREVEEFRRLHDPAFHRVAAHLPLVAPFEPLDADLVARFDALRGAAAFDVTWGPAAVAGRALVLPVSDGEAQVDLLRAALTAELAPPLADTPRLAPALRLGLFGGDAEIELARRAFSTLPPPPGFRVRELSLLVEDERGLWHAVRERRLG
jgi:hypothetical protein